MNEGSQTIGKTKPDEFLSKVLFLYILYHIHLIMSGWILQRLSSCLRIPKSLRMDAAGEMFRPDASGSIGQPLIWEYPDMNRWILYNSHALSG